MTFISKSCGMINPKAYEIVSQSFVGSDTVEDWFVILHNFS